MRLKKVIFGIVLSLISISSIGQDGFTLYNMRAIPQSNTLNPALLPAAKTYIGLPVVSSIYLQVQNTGFTVQDIIKLENGKYSWDLENAIKNMESTNFIGTNLRFDLFSFGFRAGNNFIGFHAQSRTSINMYYPKGLFQFLYHGNGGANLGERIAFDNIGVDFLQYFEYGATFGRKINKYLTVAARVKYLRGVAALYTEKSKFGIYTDPSTYAWTIDGGVEINTSGLIGGDTSQTLQERIVPDITNTSDIQNIFYDSNSDNNGIAFDFGATYNFFDIVTFSGGVNDLGSLNWGDKIQNYKSDDFSLSFNGVDVFDVFSIDSDTSSSQKGAFDNILDSALAIKDGISQNKNSFTTPLNTQFYLGAQYNLTNRLTLGVLTRNIRLKNEWRSTLSTSLTATMRNFLSFNVNSTFTGNSIPNVGLGWSLNIGPIQWYFLTDNIMTVPYWYNTKNIHLRTGVNFTFKRDYEN